VLVESGVCASSSRSVLSVRFARRQRSAAVTDPPLTVQSHEHHAHGRESLPVVLLLHVLIGWDPDAGRSQPERRTVIQR
jgi:hypothetical protein